MSKLKYQNMAQVLEKRIQFGEYLMTGFPSERRLAEQFEVSQITVRKAIQILTDKGMISRKANGRVEVTTGKSGSKKQLKVAFLAPAYSGPMFDYWRNECLHVSSQMDICVRMVEYIHWDDSGIEEVLQNFDGAFFIPLSEVKIPKNFVRDRLTASGAPVVSLGTDLSESGIPSILLYQYSFIPKLLDHIRSFGHKRIDFFNGEPESQHTQRAIQQWKLWLSMTENQGKLINRPVENFGDAGTHSRQSVLDLIDTGKLNASALLCSSARVAMGVVRAMHERGIAIGKEISVASVSADNDAHLLCPSITSITSCDPRPFFKLCLEWMQRGGNKWEGSLSLVPQEMNLLEGESLGPAPRTEPNN